MRVSKTIYTRLRLLANRSLSFLTSTRSRSRSRGAGVLETEDFAASRPTAGERRTAVAYGTGAQRDF
jgi:hypothetical protein